MQCFDFIIAGAMYLISGIMFWSMTGIEAADSKILPTVIAVLLIILATLLIIARLKNKEKESYDFTNTQKALLLLLILLVYTFCSDLFGFYVCTPFFLVGAMYFLGQRNKKVLILVPIIMTVAVVVLFYYIFQIPLPEGKIFNIFELLR